MSKILTDGEKEIIVYTEDEYKELETKYNNLVNDNNELKGKYDELIEGGKELPEEPTVDDQFKHLFPDLYNIKK